MRIAICDDEKSVAQILEKKVKKRLPDATVELYLSREALVASGCRPDLLFLDIQMPGMDGMRAEHGIGLHNIRRVAQLYMGAVSFEQGDGEVTLSIMLQVE